MCALAHKLTVVISHRDRTRLTRFDRPRPIFAQNNLAFLGLDEQLRNLPKLFSFLIETYLKFSFFCITQRMAAGF